MELHTYQCPNHCHIRFYPLWVGEDAEKCPRCGEFMLYIGKKTQEQIHQSLLDRAKNQKKSKKQLKKRKRK